MDTSDITEAVLILITEEGDNKKNEINKKYSLHVGCSLQSDQIEDCRENLMALYVRRLLSNDIFEHVKEIILPGPMEVCASEYSVEERK